MERPATGLDVRIDAPIFVGNCAEFVATTSTGTNLHYTWDMGDGTVQTGRVVHHTYAASGQYTITVTADNTIGFQAMTVVVEVCNP
ncbi:MAG: PKD domain-containing protein [Chloroflexaceae bacterium]|nr:PKD domain-containing protein [Chloroflexaceae bacterium]